LLHALVRKPAAKGHYDLSKPPPARQILRAFRAARPKIQKIALLHGSGGPTRLAEIRRAAKRLQIEIIPLAANSPAEAIRLLRKNAMRFEGLWLLPDLSILTPQVFQYAIGLQFRYRIALMGATRPHVDKGALFAIDHDPHLLGRRAAIVANRLLSARRISRPETIAGISHRLTVNRFTASRIRVNLAPLRKIATEVVP
jgi:putative ABC transport system substrate-binding protein